MSDGGPAFPLAIAVSVAGDLYDSSQADAGMSLRVYLASIETKFSHPKTGRYDFGMHPAVWCDKAGVLHRAVGAEIHRDIPRLLWTACGKKDVPANAAWLQRAEDNIDCPDCEAWEIACAAMGGEG